MSSPKRLARIAGLLYLIVGIFGGEVVRCLLYRTTSPQPYMRQRLCHPASPPTPNCQCYVCDLHSNQRRRHTGLPEISSELLDPPQIGRAERFR
jgi:hypothetical protein